MKLLLIFMFASAVLYTAATDNINENRAQQIDTYIEQPHPYDLNSDNALKVYLPARLKELVAQVKKNGIQTTAHNLANDPDLDSYLFIIDAQQPYRLLAYSRTPAFSNKTPHELQALIFPACHADACNIERTFTHIVATAHKGTTYARYLWQADLEQAPQYQIAYVQLITENKKEYVLGAAIYHKWSADHIILPHRINTMLKRIKKEGLENIINEVNDDPDPELYFFITSLKYPNRYLAQGGGGKWLVSKTPDDEQAAFTRCSQEACNLRVAHNKLITLAKKGGGFHAYLLPQLSTKSMPLKIAYVQKFSHNKKNYMLATGRITHITDTQVKELENTAKHALNLIKTIGLDNAISTLKKTPQTDRFIFITQAEPPYRYLLHPNPLFNNSTTKDIQAYYSRFKNFPINVTELVKKIVSFTQEGGGLHAFEYLVNPDAPEEGNSIEVSYSVPFEYAGKKYFISIALPIEQTDVSLKKMVAAP